MADEWRIYKTGMEVVHDGDPDQEIRIYKVGFEIIRDLRDLYSPAFTDGSDEEVFEGFSFGLIFGAGEYGWDFVDGSDDFVTNGISFGQLPFTIPDRERNPYPTHPDRDTETFIAEQQRVIRDQHNRTQAGDSTFDYGLLLKGTPDRLYTLGSLGRFYHDDYGIILARYVQFQGCVQTIAQGAPVGYLSTSRTIDWIVTNDITKSSAEQAMGVMCLAEIPEDGTYGWVVTEGAVPVIMGQDSGLIPAPETPYAWSQTGHVDIGIVGKIIGRRWGKAISPTLTAGTIYVRLEGFSPASLAEIIHAEMVEFETQVAEHETRLDAHDTSITNINNTNSVQTQDITNLTQRIANEEEARRRADTAIHSLIGSTNWSATIIAGDNAVRAEFATADDALRVLVSNAQYRADQAYTMASGVDGAAITANFAAINTQLAGLGTRITNLVIDDLADVDTVTTPPTDGDVLTWVAADSEWIPAAPTGGGGAAGSLFRAERRTTFPSNITGNGTFYTTPFNTVTEAQSWASLDTATGIITLSVGVYIVHAAARVDGGVNQDWWTAHIGVDGTAERDPFGMEFTNEPVSIPFATSMVAFSVPGTVQFVIRVGGDALAQDLTMSWIQIAKIG